MPTLNIRNATLAYTDQGEGEAVILAHGSASSRRQWRHLVADLSTRYRVLAPDFYGYGETSLWPTVKKLTLPDEGALIMSLAERVDGPVHLVGHSYGGAICLSMAHELREKLASLTLIEPVAFQLLRHQPDHWAWIEIKEIANRHLSLAERGDLSACAEVFMSYWIGKDAWFAMPSPMRAAITESMPKVAAEWRMLFDAEDRPATYAGLDVPVLLIRGEQTTRAARGVVDVLAATLPRQQLIEIKGAGHMSPLTHPGAVNAAISAHLNRHSVQKTSKGRRDRTEYGARSRRLHRAPQLSLAQ